MLKHLQLTTILAVTLSAAFPAQVTEYQVKAALLYKFVQFVTWPPESFSSPSDPVVACVLGETSFAYALKESVRGKLVWGRPLVVREVADSKQAKSCQILFVAALQRKQFRSILADLMTTPILTVADTDGFTDAGGVVNLISEGAIVHFQINVTAAKQNNLQVSSKLLSLAQIVK